MVTSRMFGGLVETGSVLTCGRHCQYQQRGQAAKGCWIHGKMLDWKEQPLAKEAATPAGP